MTDTKPGAGIVGKEVLYIDIDDEITGIIDKMRASKQKIVALVLPKRATVFQSIVNMKLLKRAADAEKKNVVLITSEAGLLPLAATVGVHVAKNLQSRPEIPEGMTSMEEASDAIEEIAADEPTPSRSSDKSSTNKPNKQSEAQVDKARTVGELAGAAALDEQLDESIDLSNEDDDAVVSPAAVVGGKPKKGKDKKLKVPNFKRFRILMVAIILVLAVGIFGLVFAMKALAKATINIQTDSTATNSSTVITASPASGTTLSTSSGTIAATSVQSQKSATAQVNASGQQNNGNKAAGTVTLALTDCANNSVTIPAGTGVTSNNLTFITQQSATLQSITVGGKCHNSQDPAVSTATVNVIAQSGGASYNLQSSTNFTVSGYSDVSASNGAAMAGGTDNIVQIVTQNDISTAEQKLTSADTTSIKQQLQAELQQKGLFPLPASFNPGTPNVTTNVQAGSAASSVTATSNATYTMLGVSQSDLQAIVKADIGNKTNLANQQILDYGLSNAVFGLQSQNSDGGATLTVQTTVVIGSALNTTAIKQQVEGMKSGDAQSTIKQYPGVTNVTVSYSPFWVNSIPKNPSKITIYIQKPTATKSSSSSNAGTSQ